MLLAAVEAQPTLPAVIYRDRRITYAELGRATAGLAAQLRSNGIGRGSRVALLMANSIEMDVALFAVMAAGAQVAPLNPFLTAAELRKVFVDIEASLLICDQAAAPKAAELAVEFAVSEQFVLGVGGMSLETWIRDPWLVLEPHEFPRADDLALLIFTGGSTGVPKGVDHTHAALLWACLQHATVWPLGFGEERFLNVAPMFHIWGLGYATLMPIFAQSTLVMVPRYEPDKVVAGVGGAPHHGLRGRSRSYIYGLAREPVVRRRRSVGPEVLPVGRRAVPRGAAPRVARQGSASRCSKAGA